MSGLCRVCGKELDDVGTCTCVTRSDVGNKPPVAETLRRMADRYQTLAEDYQAIGRYADAESNRRLVREFLIAAEEVESRLFQAEMSCSDGTEEFE